MELLDYVKMLQRRGGFILIVVLLGTIVAYLLGSVFIKPVFEANTKLIVNKVTLADGAQHIDMTAVTANIMLIGSYKEIIKSPAIMDLVVEQHPELGVTAKELIENVKVTSANNSQIMSITIREASYKQAAQIVNAVTKVFQKEIGLIMAVDNVSILNEAPPIDRPVPIQTSIKLIAAAGLFASLIIAVGVSLLLEHLDDKIRVEADSALILGIPTLAVISRMHTNGSLQSLAAPTERKVGEQTYVKISQ
jgi:capsular polysaccharide biosynthesis protein